MSNNDFIICMQCNEETFVLKSKPLYEEDGSACGRICHNCRLENVTNARKCHFKNCSNLNKSANFRTIPSRFYDLPDGRRKTEIIREYGIHKGCKACCNLCYLRLGRLVQKVNTLDFTQTFEHNSKNQEQGCSKLDHNSAIGTSSDYTGPRFRKRKKRNYTEIETENEKSNLVNTNSVIQANEKVPPKNNMFEFESINKDIISQFSVQPLFFNQIYERNNSPNKRKIGSRLSKRPSRFTDDISSFIVDSDDDEIGSITMMANKGCGIQTNAEPVVENSQVKEESVIDIFQVIEEPVIDIVQVKEEPVIDIVQVKEEPVVKSIQVMEEPVIENIQVKEEPVVENIKHVEEQVVENIKHVEEPVVENIKHVEEPVVENIKHVEEQVVENIQHVEEPVDENIQVVEELVIEYIQVKKEPVIENIQDVEEPVNENIQVREEQVIENIQVKEEPVIENIQVLEEPVVKNIQGEEEPVVENIQGEEEPVFENIQVVEEPVVENIQGEEEPLVVDIEEPVVESSRDIEEPAAKNNQDIEEPADKNNQIIEEPADKNNLVIEQALNVIQRKGEDIDAVEVDPTGAQSHTSEDNITAKKIKQQDNLSRLFPSLPGNEGEKCTVSKCTTLNCYRKLSTLPPSYFFLKRKEKRFICSKFGLKSRKCCEACLLVIEKKIQSVKEGLDKEYQASLRKQYTICQKCLKVSNETLTEYVVIDKAIKVLCSSCRLLHRNDFEIYNSQKENHFKFMRIFDKMHEDFLPDVINDSTLLQAQLPIAVAEKAPVQIHRINKHVQNPKHVLYNVDLVDFFCSLNEQENSIKPSGFLTNVAISKSPSSQYNFCRVSGCVNLNIQTWLSSYEALFVTSAEESVQKVLKIFGLSSSKGFSCRYCFTNMKYYLAHLTDQLIIKKSKEQTNSKMLCGEKVNTPSYSIVLPKMQKPPMATEACLVPFSSNLTKQKTIHESLLSQPSIPVGACGTIDTDQEENSTNAEIQSVYSLKPEQTSMPVNQLNCTCTSNSRDNLSTIVKPKYVTTLPTSVATINPVNYKRSALKFVYRNVVKKPANLSPNVFSVPDVSDKVNENAMKMPAIETVFPLKTKNSFTPVKLSDKCNADVAPINFDDIPMVPLTKQFKNTVHKPNISASTFNSKSSSVDTVNSKPNVKAAFVQPKVKSFLVTAALSNSETNLAVSSVSSKSNIIFTTVNSQPNITASPVNFKRDIESSAFNSKGNVTTDRSNSKANITASTAHVKSNVKTVIVNSKPFITASTLNSKPNITASTANEKSKVKTVIVNSNPNIAASTIISKPDIKSSSAANLKTAAVHSKSDVTTNIDTSKTSVTASTVHAKTNIKTSSVNIDSSISVDSKLITENVLKPTLNTFNSAKKIDLILQPNRNDLVIPSSTTCSFSENKSLQFKAKPTTSTKQKNFIPGLNITFDDHVLKLGKLLLNEFHIRLNDMSKQHGKELFRTLMKDTVYKEEQCRELLQSYLYQYQQAECEETRLRVLSLVVSHIPRYHRFTKEFQYEKDGEIHSLTDEQIDKAKKLLPLNTNISSGSEIIDREAIHSKHSTAKRRNRQNRINPNSSGKLKTVCTTLYSLSSPPELHQSTALPAKRKMKPYTKISPSDLARECIKSNVSTISACRTVTRNPPNLKRHATDSYSPPPNGSSLDALPGYLDRPVTLPQSKMPYLPRCDTGKSNQFPNVFPQSSQSIKRNGESTCDAVSPNKLPKKDALLLEYNVISPRDPCDSIVLSSDGLSLKTETLNRPLVSNKTETMTRPLVSNKTGETVQIEEISSTFSGDGVSTVNNQTFNTSNPKRSPTSIVLQSPASITRSSEAVIPKLNI